MSEIMIDTEEIPTSEPTYWNHESKKWTPPVMSLQNIRPFNDGFNRETFMTYVLTAGYNMLSGKWVTEKISDHLEKSSEVYDRAYAEWSTMALISSLLLTLTYQVFMTDFSDDENMGIEIIISSLSFTSTLLFITAIAAAVLLIMGLLTLPNECAALYIEEFELIATLPECATVCGVYVFAANSIFIGIAMHGTFVLNILVPILIPFVVFILLIWMYIYLVLDRKGGLWDYAKHIKKNKM